MRKATGNFKAMRKAAEIADKQFKRSADMRQAAEGVSRFAAGASRAFFAPINAAMDFNYEMSRVRALSKSGEADFAALRDKALELGASIGEFSALDVAKGMSEFAIAGYDANKVMKSMPTALNLSTAAQTSLADTIKITTGIMGGFGLGADDMQGVGDILATTMTGSKTSIEGLGETFSYVGSTAKKAGMSLADTAVMAGILGNASKEGSRGGTALNAILLRLAAPRRMGRGIMQELGLQIEEVVNGTTQMRKPVAILADIADKIEGLSNRKQLAILGRVFGSEAAPAVAELMDKIGGDEMRKLDRDVRQATGGLRTMSGIMRDNTKTAAMELSSSIDTLNINVGDTMDANMKTLYRTLAGVVSKMNEFAQSNPNATKAIVGTIGVTALLATGLAGLMFAATAASTALGVMAIALGSNKTGVELLGGALRWTILRLKAFAVAIWTRVLPAIGRWTLAMLMRLAPTMTIFAAGIWATVVPAIKAFAVTIWTRAIPAMIAWIAKMWASSTAALAAAAPFLVIAAAIGAITLAIIELVKHWDELDFAEGMRGITEAIGESGVLSTMAELFDPRTLLQDMGIMGGTGSGQLQTAAQQVTRPAVAGAGAQQVGGEIGIKIESDQPTRVTRAESKGGIGLAIDTGFAMVTP